MNIALKTDETKPASDDVICLDDPNLWDLPAFRTMLLASIERDGFDAETRLLAAKAFDVGSLSGPADLARVAQQQTFSIEEREKLLRLAEHWQRVSTFNKAVYGVSSIQDYKTRHWPNNAKLKSTRWEYYQDLYECDVFAEAKRFITRETAITSAGSCFARNIALQLQHWKYNYLVEMAHVSKDDAHAGTGYSTDPAACGNIYNAVSMRQMIERAFGEWAPPKLLATTKPRFSDPFRRADDYDDLAGYHRKWSEHDAALGRAFRKSEVFILTLGMTEAWVLADSGAAISSSPRHGDTTLLRHKNLTVEDNVNELERLYAVFKKHNPRIKFITTVSPVPLNATFNAGTHVVTANGLSKATLRVALDIFSLRHPDDVFYFPSYEIVTTATKDPWDIDLRHVSNNAIARVMIQFQRMFMLDQEPLDILPVVPIADFIPQKRRPVLRYGREFVIHPLKRALGIQGRSFSALLNRRKAP